ncbi:Mu transposase C-terminal domain-containing protein [Escherichia coli]|nr:Mu transposase C-terminal domain-containing protein [Escherichia coli]MDM4917254.1 Mu transposase C-terminal domain-containing protein [Escherichia coli]
MDEIPTFEQLMTAIELEVRRYNNRPHSSLPRKEDGEHYSPAAYRRKLIKEQNVEIDFLSPEELHEMFRPEVTRKTFRGEIQLFNNIYYSYELAAEHGNEVRVSYDIHDETASLSGGMMALISAMPSGTVTRLMPSLNQLSNKNWRNASGAALHGPRRKSKRLNASLPRPLRRNLTLILDLVWSVRRKRKKKNFISLHPSVTAI